MSRIYQEYTDMKEQRDELLAAAEQVAGSLSYRAIDWAALRAAIAKAKGE